MESKMPDSVTEQAATRKFADVYPAIKQRFIQYMRESKWMRVAPMTPDLAKLWVQQMSLWTRTAFKIRGHVYANCPHPALRRAMLEILSEEDVEDPRVGMNHRQLLATSLGRATGQALADLGAVRPLPTTLVTFDILYGIADRSWEEGIAVASGLERVLRDSGYFRFEHDRLKRDLGWTDKDVAWFSGHDIADEEHGSIIEQLDDHIVDDRTWDRVEEAVVESGIAWWLLFDGVVDAQRQSIAPVVGRSCKGLSLHF
jgi:pyrroloquinoline quinone (PQQ) biosynthesis protein C